jgi:peptide/nickel transport system substrate-binding protein
MRARAVRRSGRLAIGSVVVLSLVAAACGDDDDSSDEETTEETAAPVATEATEETEAPADTEATEDTEAPADTEDTEAEVSAPEVTEPPAPEVEPVYGGKIVFAGEAEVANPWTPAAMQCDSYCQQRARTFYDPLAVIDDQLEVQPFLAESIEANEDDTVFTIKVREGISFHDGTPLDADAVMDNLNRSFSGLLLAAAAKDLARNEDGTLLMEKLDDFTFTLQTGLDGNPAEPIPWPTFPIYLTGQGGLIASPTWLAEVDGGGDSTQAVGTGPFVFSSYAPGDRLVVTRNPDYWLTDADGNQLPYLDELEFRVIPDSQVRAEALRSGDLDMMASSTTEVVRELEGDENFETTLQDQFTETNYVLLHLTKPALASKQVRCALWQAIDTEQLLAATTAGLAEPSTAVFSPGQEGYLEDNGAPPYDPAAAAEAIAAYEAENGPVTINFSATPIAVNLTTAQFLQQAWGAVGVDVTIDQIEQSRLINNALVGDPAFDAFGWRNHGGLYVDQQYFWWHGSSAAPDGELALNFGRLDDPEINSLLEQARSESDPDVRRQLAEDINRRFASECYVLPSNSTLWGVTSIPAVENIGRSPIPDSDRFMRDGAGFGGQVWLTAAFLAE